MPEVLKECNHFLKISQFPSILKLLSKLDTVDSSNRTLAKETKTYLLVVKKIKRRIFESHLKTQFKSDYSYQITLKNL